MQIFKKHTCTYMAKKDTERKVTKLYWFEMNKTRKTVTLIYLKVYSLVCVMQRLCGHPIQGHSVLKIAWKYKKTPPPPTPPPLNILFHCSCNWSRCWTLCTLYIHKISLCHGRLGIFQSVNQRTRVHEDVHVFCPACILELVHQSKRMGQGTSCQCLP